MTEKGLLIVLSGPSGVGKGTVLRRFLEREGKNCALSVSATTRAPREGEIDGQDYFFIGRERFSEMIAAGEMLEYATYNDNLYGTPVGAVDSRLEQGVNVILEIEVEGAMSVKRQRPDAVLVFIVPPSWQVLRSRLEGRGSETEESVSRRMRIAEREMPFAEQYDYILINEDLDRCCEELADVVSAAAHSIRVMKRYLEEVFFHA